jgi:hypothetical protein
MSKHYHVEVQCRQRAVEPFMTTDFSAVIAHYEGVVEMLEGIPLAVLRRGIKRTELSDDTVVSWRVCLGDCVDRLCYDAEAVEQARLEELAKMPTDEEMQRRYMRGEQ